MYAISKSDIHITAQASAVGGASMKAGAMLPNVTSGFANYQALGDTNGDALLMSSAVLNKFEHSLYDTSYPSHHVVNSSSLKLENDEDGEVTGDDSTNDEWEPDAKLSKAADYKVTSPSYSSTDSNGPTISTKSTKVSNRPTGPRKPRKEQQLTPEEEEKRKLRRERNKQAAAKCRQKRVDLTNQLMAETETLESEQMRLQEEIKIFQREKEELELILNTHRIHCGSNTVGSLGNTTLPNIITNSFTSVSNARSQSNSVTSVTPTCTVSQGHSVPTSNADVKTEIETVVTSCKESLMSTVVTTAVTMSAPLAVVMTPVVSSSQVCRPNSFPTSSFRSLAMVATPSGPNVLTFGLESMLDGHTGLTPITGMPACAIAIVGGHHFQASTPSDTPSTVTDTSITGGLTHL